MRQVTIWEVLEIDGNGGSDKVVCLFKDHHEAKKLVAGNSWKKIQEVKYIEFVVEYAGAKHALLFRITHNHVPTSLPNTIAVNVSTPVFHSYADYQEALEKNLVKSALNKLSPQEREALSKHKFSATAG